MLKKSYLHNRIVIQSSKIVYVNINVSVVGQAFFQTSHGDYFLIEFIICMKYGTFEKLTFNKIGLVKKCNFTTFVLLIMLRQINVRIKSKPESTLKRTVKTRII